MINDELQKSLYQMGRVVMLGVRELMGQAGVNAVANVANRPGMANLLAEDESGVGRYDDISSVQTALEVLYGPRGGKGVALRVGRASFKFFIRQFGEQMGLTKLDYRLLPTQPRLKVGLQAMAATFTSLYAGAVDIAEDEEAWFWQMKNCPWCISRTVPTSDSTQQGACHYLVGMLQEFLAWASGGKIYSVREVECTAEGQPGCIFRIEKLPLE